MNRQILILEDDLLLRRQMASFLRGEGASVDEAACLQEARNFLTSRSFDFALLDLHLPDGLGTELLNEGSLGTAEAIVMTADADLDTALRVLKNGALDYLAKPFDLSDLSAVLADCKRAGSNLEKSSSRF